MMARDAAVAALIKIHEQGGYSNIVLDDVLESGNLSESDRAFASRIIYGVIERRMTLDHFLNKTSSTPVKQMTSAIREILRVGAYQLVYMEKVPNFAAINEAVHQTRTFRCARLSGYVNAVLRQVERTYESLLELPSNDKGLELRYSVPRQWIRIWRGAYGDAHTFGLLNSVNEAPPAYIRVNTMVTTVDDFCLRLDEQNISYQRVQGLPNAIKLVSSMALHSLPDELRNHYYFQDIASQWSCVALGAKPGERIADVCAAPGGKTMTVAQDMRNEGCVAAGDLHDHKVRAMTKRVKHYGLSIISVRQRDASCAPDDSEVATFDRVICDVPCSGLGVIRRKPEIRYKQLDEFATLPQLQLQILQQAAHLVRPGGVLQYSTCTLHPAENEDVTAAFLAQNPDFEPRYLPLDICFAQSQIEMSHQITLFPHIHGSDGFYIAGFTRKA